jgi:hypothetical protein
MFKTFIEAVSEAVNLSLFIPRETITIQRDPTDGGSYNLSLNYVGITPEDEIILKLNNGIASRVEL